MKKTKIISLPDLNEARAKKDKINYIHQDIVYDEFLANFLNGKKYLIKTHGCQANQRDSETLAGMLDFYKMTSTDDPHDADIIIINTCAVRENAEDKVFGEIGNLKALKEANKDLIICVCGCMVLQSHIISKLIDTYKQVDLIFGTHNIPEFLNLLKQAIIENIRLVNVISSAGDVFEINADDRKDSYKAFVNISYGCDKFCAYCIVPYTRGRERSRLKEDILNEVNCLIKKGYKEITLLGQNVNSYGKDLYKDYDFSNLLEDVAKTGIERLRFITSHPWDFNDKMIDVISKYDNIMKYIHLPVQSGSTRILKLMNRRYTKQDYLNLVDKLRSKIKNLSLSTDIIVGFPNETEEDFQETLDLVDKVKYDSAFTFIYSKRVGTPAAKINDTVSDKEKSERFLRLVKKLEEYISKKAETYVGTIQKVLVDGFSKKNKNILSGYTEDNKLVNFKGDPSKIGKIIKVKIIESHTYSLIGEEVDE